MSEQMCGGPSAIKDADDTIQDICDKIRDDLEKKVGHKFSKFTAIQYMSQVVAGTNYFVKIHIGSDKYVHARIYNHFSGSTELNNCKTDLAEDEQLVYF